MRNKYVFAMLTGIIAVISSCNHLDYESGDGGLSYLHADFADITIEEGRVVSIITDDDVSLHIPAISYDGEANKLIRRLIYYNKVDEVTPIKLLGQKTVNIMKPYDKDLAEVTETSPVKLIAAWLSANHRYVNVQVGVVTGSADDAQKHRLQLVTESVSMTGKGAVNISLRHDRGGLPQYYTQDVYMSIPTQTLPDTIRLTINTYSGITTRTFIK